MWRPTAHTSKIEKKCSRELGVVQSGESLGSARQRSVDRTKADIIRAAIEEFSEYGYAGGRIENISERTKTSKRMVYYYFGDKDGVYAAALREFYVNQRSTEEAFDLEHVPALDALKTLVGVVYDYHIKHAEHLRLVMGENIARGRHISRMRDLKKINSRILDRVEKIYRRGVEAGSMRAGIQPIDLYAIMTSLHVFSVSHRYTFSFNFDYDMKTKKAIARRRDLIIDCVTRFVAI